jgi:polygalacturonase
LKTGARLPLDVLLFVDHPAATADASWVDVTLRGVAADGTTNSTAQIQALLDGVASSGGGGIHFPTGVYRTGPFRIGSRTTIHLAAGAVVKAIDESTKFDRHFLLIDGAEDVRLFGAGVIDGNGTALLRSKPAFIRQLHGLVIRDSKRVRVEGLVLRECCDWNVHILRSSDVAVDRVRLFARKDGFAADSSRDVSITDCFALSTDDTVLVCSSGADHPASNVRVTGGLFGSSAVALKIGSLTAAPIRDVTFEDCEVFNSSRAFAIETRHPIAKIDRVVWRNIRASLDPAVR